MYEFLGFNEDPYASVPTSVGFVADIPKRDAVVAAFKVSVLYAHVSMWLKLVVVLIGVLPTTAFTARYTLLCLAIPCAFSMGGPQASWLTGNLRNTGETTLIIPLNASISSLGQMIGKALFL